MSKTYPHEITKTLESLPPLPLVVFLHGAMSHALQNTALMEELASWGYAVCSIGHPYESGGVVLESKEVALAPSSVVDSLTALGRNPDFVRHSVPLPYQERLKAVRAKVRLARTSWVGSWIGEWAQDALVVIDRIAARALPPAARNLAAAIDTEAVGVVGMSYGGAVATRLSYLDDRARACINLDGTTWTWDVVGQSIPTPLLALHSDATYFKPVFSALGIDVGEALDQLTAETPLHSDLDYEPHASLGLREDVYRWSLRGITHLGLTDHLFLEKGTTPIPVGVGPLAGVAGAALINRICRSFLDTYLRGERERFPAGLLDHTSIVRREMSSLRLQALNNSQGRLFEREA